MDDVLKKALMQSIQAEFQGLEVAVEDPDTGKLEQIAPAPSSVAFGSSHVSLTAQLTNLMADALGGDTAAKIEILSHLALLGGFMEDETWSAEDFRNDVKAALENFNKLREQN